MNMIKEEVRTEDAPLPGGCYSQAIKFDKFVFLSGQIPIVLETNLLVEGGIEKQMEQCFLNLSSVCKASGGTLDDIVSLRVYLTSQEHSSYIDKSMKKWFNLPYPARVRLFVSSLSKGSLVEIEGIMAII